MRLFKKFYMGLTAAGTSFQDVLLLIIRLYWGYSFFVAGLGKLLDVPKVAGFFEKINIAFPLFNAYLVGFVECFGGLFFILGFATRLTAIPLIITMCVAMVTAHWEAVAAIWTSPYGLIKESPFTYLIVSLILFAFGPGKLSVDALIEAYLNKEKQKKS